MNLTAHKHSIMSVSVYVALVSQRAKHMRSIMLSSVACSVLQYFATLPHTLHDFRRKKL